MMNLEKLVPAIVKIARKAGDAILEIYEKPDFKIEEKDDQSPLTLADKASNKVICEGLEMLEPSFPIISEENKALPFSERKNYEYCWLVDPLDGTKEFIKRNGEFTVNIALIHQARPVLGVVYVPVMGEMFWACQGGGAFMEKNGKKEALRASRFHLSDSRLKLVCSRSHLNEETEKFVSQFTEPELVSKGSSLKFLILAQGEAHIYPRIAPTMEWDTGAAQIIVEEAGGKVVQFENQEPVQYNKENLLNPFFVAYGNVEEA